MAAARADVATYRDILEIFERIKKPDVKKDFKEHPHYVASGTNNIYIPQKQRFNSRSILICQKIWQRFHRKR